MYIIRLRKTQGKYAYKKDGKLLDQAMPLPTPPQASVVDVPEHLTTSTDLQNGSSIKKAKIYTQLQSIALNEPSSKLKKFISLKL